MGTSEYTKTSMSTLTGESFLLHNATNQMNEAEIICTTWMTFKGREREGEEWTYLMEAEALQLITRCCSFHSNRCW